MRAISQHHNVRTVRETRSGVQCERYHESIGVRNKRLALAAVETDGIVAFATYEPSSSLLIGVGAEGGGGGG